MPRNRDRNGDWGVVEMARERPFAAAAAAAGAAAAGLFLWSKRTQISNQLSSLSDQIGEWSQNMSSGDWGWSTTGEAGTQKSTRSQRGMNETGGGNASLGARSGGGGSTRSASGRGRAKSTAATRP